MSRRRSSSLAARPALFVLACGYGHSWCAGPKPSKRDGTIAPPVRCAHCERASKTAMPLLDAREGEEFSS